MKSLVDLLAKMKRLLSENLGNLERKEPQVDYCRIPLSDMTWVAQQPPSVFKLFISCWSSDRFGSRWNRLNHNLSQSSFRFARRLLEGLSLFVFRKVQDYADTRVTAYWEVRNLKGCRVSEFWRAGSTTKPKTSNFSKNNSDLNINILDSLASKNDFFEEKSDKNSAPIHQKSLNSQSFCELSISSQEPVNNSSIELLTEKDKTKNNFNNCFSDLPRPKLLKQKPENFSTKHKNNKTLKLEDNQRENNLEEKFNTPESIKKFELEFQKSRDTPEYSQAKEKATFGLLNKLKEKVLSSCKNPHRRQLLKNRHLSQKTNHSNSRGTVLINNKENNFSTS